jgi:carboxyl-terminal processing protease
MKLEFMMRNKIAFLLVFLLSCLPGLYAQPVEADEGTDDGVEVGLDPELVDEDLQEDHKIALEEMARFTLALEQIHRLHATSGTPVSYETLIDGAIEGMTSQLDSYSGFLGNSSAEKLRDQTRGAFVGIGVVINRSGNYVTVVSPIEGSPSWDAGLAAGDQFVGIDGEDVRGQSVQDVVNRLKGEPGSEVAITLRRPEQGRTFEVTLTRSLIENKSVGTYELLEDGIGYIRIKTFTENTAQLLRKQMTGLKKKNATAMVLDLRGNPGGLLRSAVEVSSLFLPKETLVVFTEGNEEGSRKDYITTTRPHRFEPKLIVLVNEGSASAAEIVSGALQDHDRATLVGAKTFGKASVQSILPLPDGSALRLTTAKYYTPSKREIHGKGIEPDVNIPLPMYRWIRMTNRPAEDWDWERDPQLKKAVELLKAPEVPVETALESAVESEG